MGALFQRVRVLLVALEERPVVGEDGVGKVVVLVARGAAGASG